MSGRGRVHATRWAVSVVLAVGAVVPLTGLAGAATSAEGGESERFAAFLAEVYRQDLAASPELATAFGSKEGADRWDDTSEPALRAEADRARRQLERAKAFDERALDAAGRLQLRVFVDEQRLLLERYRWRDHFYAINQIVGLHIDIPGVLTGEQPLDSEGDARVYVRRIAAAGPALRVLSRHLRAQAARGIYMPRSVYPLLIEGAQNVITGAPHDAGPDSTILADFKRRVGTLGLPPAAEAPLIADARAALVDRLEPGYRELIQVLTAQAVRSPVTGGVWQLNDGDRFYAFLVRQFTTTDMTPEQIHAMGLAEVARCQDEIRALFDRVGFKGSLREFATQVHADAGQYFSNDDAGRTAYLARARGIVSAMQARIPTAFARPVPLPLEILRTDAYKEASSPPGFYEPGTADGRRPGRVYLNLSNMQLMPLFELDDLLYHEGVPGHHLQISTILLDGTIPQMRKVNQWWQDSAFVEGWALYAERLAKEMGFYRDPYAEFGLLSGELWRATRLVVDSGLHYKRWTRAQAIDYLNEHTPSAPETNERAVDRYLAVPGQATSFTVGMRKFIAERERARAALGARFDLREYHRVALSSGYVPLWALEQNVSDWIARSAH